MDQLEKIRVQHQLHTFLQDCEELHVKTEVRNNQVQKHHPQQVDQAPSLPVRDPEQQGEA